MIHAAKQLEAEESLAVKFDTSRLRLVFNDRLNNENSDEGFAAVSDAIEGALKEVFGGDVMAVLHHRSPLALNRARWFGCPAAL